MKEPKVIECDSTPALPVLVMISGLSIDHSWLEDLSRQFIALRPRVARVALFSLPGHGGAEPLAGSHDEGCIAHHMRDKIERLVPGGAERQLILLGYSAGALVACKFACLFPDRVEALCLVAAGGLAPGLTQRFISRLAKSRCGSCALPAFFSLGKKGAAAGPGGNASAPLSTTDPATATRLCRDLSYYTRECGELYRAAAALGKPTLIVSGGRDVGENPRQKGREMLKQIFASSDELYLPDATHFVAVEEAAAIARALVTFTSFLRPEGGLRLARML